MELLILLVMILATWRLTNLIMFESGPFNIFTRLRNLFLKEKEEIFTESFFEGLLSCVYCFSMWTGAIFSAMTCFLLNTLLLFIPLTLAFSAGTIFLDKLNTD